MAREIGADRRERSKRKKGGIRRSAGERGVALHGRSLEEAWDEIGRLKGEIDALQGKQNRQTVKFCNFNVGGVTGTGLYKEVGFRPYLVWMMGQFAADASVLTFGCGFAVEDLDEEGIFTQQATAIRRDAAGGGRAWTPIRSLAMFSGSADAVIDQHVTIESFEPTGFYYSINLTIPFIGGFVIGK